MRIAVVNDVPSAVEAISRVVLRGHHHDIAWIAHDGAEAVELCARDRPDLVMMDLLMPRMDGVEATRRIMAQTSCPIVVVTADVATRSSKVFEAMGAGALDAVNTPPLRSAVADGAGHVLLAKIEAVRKLIGAGPAKASLPQKPLPPARLHPHYWLVAIGASAGGPGALARLLAPLPADFPAPVVIIQHVDALFAQGLADWLSSKTRLPVRLAREGDRPQPGTVLLAGRGQHLLLNSHARLGYAAAPLDSPYRPSIDLFFKSADRHWRGQAVAVLLTGMGRDGAEGLALLRAHGWRTIAQDRRSCVVYGMPKAADELGAADEILPLDKIGPRLLNIVTEHLD
jgi:two-component system response regulator WspF